MLVIRKRAKTDIYKKILACLVTSGRGDIFRNWTINKKRRSITKMIGLVDRWRRHFMAVTLVMVQISSGEKVVSIVFVSAILLPLNLA